MAELDIDKMLEEREKKEIGKQKKTKSANTALFVAIGAVVLAAVAGLAMLITGESAYDYIPFDSGKKVSVNRAGGSPEEWKFLDKAENYMGYECYVMNKTDLATNMSTQEYYADTEKGIALIGYSENFGEKRKSIMIMLPPKIKLNKAFESAAGITGVVSGAEKESSGKIIKVDYKGNGIDISRWYLKGTGLVRTEDRVSGITYGLIAVQ